MMASRVKTEQRRVECFRICSCWAMHHGKKIRHKICVMDKQRKLQKHFLVHSQLAKWYLREDSCWIKRNTKYSTNLVLHGERTLLVLCCGLSPLHSLEANHAKEMFTSVSAAGAGRKTRIYAKNLVELFKSSYCSSTVVYAFGTYVLFSFSYAITSRLLKRGFPWRTRLQLLSPWVHDHVYA